MDPKQTITGTATSVQVTVPASSPAAYVVEVSVPGHYVVAKATGGSAICFVTRPGGRAHDVAGQRPFYRRQRFGPAFGQ